MTWQGCRLKTSVIYNYFRDYLHKKHYETIYKTTAFICNLIWNFIDISTIYIYTHT